MTARGWYQRFCKEYGADKCIKKLETKGYEIDGKWTPAMMALLRRMGEQMGYKVTQESAMAGRRLSDQSGSKNMTVESISSMKTDAMPRSTVKYKSYAMMSVKSYVYRRTLINCSR
jgi:hypothetical protein